MSLAWHIARKDARRLALPLAAWIALIVVPAIVFRFVIPTFAAHGEAGLREVITMMNIWVRLLTAIQLILGYALVAALVLEDPLGDTNAFWPTRPIGSGRLLRAKLAAAGLLFFVLPVTALVPVWLAGGFGPRELWQGACAFVLWQGGVTLVAFMLASLARNLAQVMLFTVLVIVADIAAIWFSGSFYEGVAVPVRIAREMVAHVVLVPIFGFVLVQQYLTRRPGRGWVTLGLAFVACFAVRAAWPWSAGSGLWMGRAPVSNETPANRAVEVVAEPKLTKPAPNAAPTLFVTAPWRGEQRIIPVIARLDDGSIAHGGMGPGSVQAGLRSLGYSKEETPLKWQLMMSGSLAIANDPNVTRRLPVWSENDPHVTGRMELWSVRPRVVGEMPLRIGAELKDGSTRTRINGLVRNDGRLDGIYLEERESASSARAAFQRYASARDATHYRTIDEYFLVDRATGKVQSVSWASMGFVEMSSLVIGFRRVGVSGGDTWENGVLIKLRFDCDHRFERPLDVRGVTDWPTKTQP